MIFSLDQKMPQNFTITITTTTIITIVTIWLFTLIVQERYKLGLGQLVNYWSEFRGIGNNIYHSHYSYYIIHYYYTSYISAIQPIIVMITFKNCLFVYLLVSFYQKCLLLSKQTKHIASLLSPMRKLRTTHHRLIE